MPLLFTVLWVYRGTPHSTTWMSPALLALGHELKMPAELSERTMVVPQTDEAHREIVEKRLQWVTKRIEGLQELRRGRRDSTQVQRFQLGQKVWKREPKYDGKGKFVPVFAPRWTGPYVVHSVYDRDVYKLRTEPSSGKKAGYLKNPVNGSHLKAFMEQEVLDLSVLKTEAKV